MFRAVLTRSLARTGRLLRVFATESAAESAHAATPAVEASGARATAGTGAAAAAAAPMTAKRAGLSLGTKVLLGASLLGAAGYAYLQTDRMEGVRRALYFYSHIGPMTAHYRYLKWKLKDSPLPKEEQDKMWEELHEKYAPELKKIILHLKGAYTKVGQVIATRTDFTPARYIEELAFLLDNMEHVPFSTVQQVLNEDLGADKINELFEYIEEEPLAAASLAQVHKARLRDGREVVVKVQYPTARRLLNDDIKTINQFVFWMYPEMKDIGKELEKQFAAELDFENEYRNLQLMKETLKRVKGVAVPDPVVGTPRALVMTYLPGRSIFKELRDGQRSPLEMFKLITIMIGVMGHQILVDGVFNGDPHPGNFLVMPDGRIGLIDFGQVKVLPEPFKLGFARLVKALAHGDKAKVVEACAEVGYRTETMNPDVLYKMISMNTDTYRFETENPLQELEELMAQDKIVHIPPDLTFLSRATQLLRGFTYNIPGVKLSAMWEPYADVALGYRKSADIYASTDVVKRAYLYTPTVIAAAIGSALAVAGTGLAAYLYWARSEA